MIGTTQAAALKNVSPRRIKALCLQGRIPSARRAGRVWIMPEDFKVVEAKVVRPSKIEMEKKK